MDTPQPTTALLSPIKNLLNDSSNEKGAGDVKTSELKTELFKEENATTATNINGSNSGSITSLDTISSSSPYHPSANYTWEQAKIDGRLLYRPHNRQEQEATIPLSWFIKHICSNMPLEMSQEFTQMMRDAQKTQPNFTNRRLSKIKVSKFFEHLERTEAKKMSESVQELNPDDLESSGETGSVGGEEIADATMSDGSVDEADQEGGTLETGHDDHGLPERSTPDNLTFPEKGSFKNDKTALKNYLGPDIIELVQNQTNSFENIEHTNTNSSETFTLGSEKSPKKLYSRKQPTKASPGKRASKIPIKSLEVNLKNNEDFESENLETVKISSKIPSPQTITEVYDDDQYFNTNQMEKLTSSDSPSKNTKTNINTSINLILTKRPRSDSATQTNGSNNDNLEANLVDQDLEGDHDQPDQLDSFDTHSQISRHSHHTNDQFISHQNEVISDLETQNKLISTKFEKTQEILKCSINENENLKVKLDNVTNDFESLIRTSKFQFEKNEKNIRNFAERFEKSEIEKDEAIDGIEEALKKFEKEKQVSLDLRYNLSLEKSKHEDETTSLKNEVSRLLAIITTVRNNEILDHHEERMQRSLLENIVEEPTKELLMAKEKYKSEKLSKNKLNKSDGDVASWKKKLTTFSGACSPSSLWSSLMRNKDNTTITINEVKNNDNDLKSQNLSSSNNTLKGEILGNFITQSPEQLDHASQKFMKKVEKDREISHKVQKCLNSTGFLNKTDETTVMKVSLTENDNSKISEIVLYDEDEVFEFGESASDDNTNNDTTTTMKTKELETLSLKLANSNLNRKNFQWRVRFFILLSLLCICAFFSLIFIGITYFKEELLQLGILTIEWNVEP